jgi:transmembrane sensor
MNNSSLHDKGPEERQAEAAAWQVHFWDNDLNSTPEFESWLMSHEGNRRAWSRVHHRWKLLDQYTTSPEFLDLRRRTLGKVRSMGRRRWASRFPSIGRLHRTAVAAAILILAGAVTYKIFGPQVYETGVGERRVVTLADGSQVQLDSLTKLRINYSEHARDLELIKGQARFDVARDVQRPFSVLAAGQKVIATGTAFNVDLLNRELFVTLIEGRVAVLPETGALPKNRPAASSSLGTGSSPSTITPSIPKPESKPIELEAGQQLTIGESGAAKVAEANVQQATAWQSGQIVVEDEPLSAVVARVNRYSPRPVTLADEKIALLRISGVFNTGDVDGFILGVTRYLPVMVEQRDNAIYLSFSEPLPTQLHNN